MLGLDTVSLVVHKLCKRLPITFFFSLSLGRMRQILDCVSYNSQPLAWCFFLCLFVLFQENIWRKCSSMPQNSHLKMRLIQLLPLRRKTTGKTAVHRCKRIISKTIYFAQFFVEANWKPTCHILCFPGDISVLKRADLNFTSFFVPPFLLKENLFCLSSNAYQY